jgi:diadenosine tetraphosphate (Ap4A) HIT family hydrolase
MSSVPQEARQEIFENAQRWVKKLTTLGIDNAQLFFNLDDKCAGASLPDHLHCQLLSRWQGDESALASRLAEDLVDAERHILLDSFYGIADKTIPKEEYVSEATQPLSEQTAYQQSLNKLVSVYKPYKQLLDSLQKPLEEMLLDSSDSRPKECYACLLKASTNDEFDRKHLVIKRFTHWILLLNRFGYIGGDSFLVTRTHGKSFVDLRPEELVELNQIIPLTQENLKKFVTAPGYNIGCSIGDCAGNPFPGHVCFNLIPRTPLDTAAITPCFGFNVIHENIPCLHKRLIEAFKDNLAL